MPYRIRTIVERFCIPREHHAAALEKLSTLWLKYKDDILERFLYVRCPSDNRFQDLADACAVLGIFTGRDISMVYDEAGNFVVVGHCRKLLEYEFEVFQMLAPHCLPCVIDGFGEDLEPWQWRFQGGTVRVVQLGTTMSDMETDSETDSEDLLQRLVRLKIDRPNRSSSCISYNQ